MNVNEIMTTNVIGVQESTTIEDAARLLARHRISGMPVTNKAGSLVGLVSEYDLIAKTGETVGDVMTRSVISVSPATAIEELTHLLVNRHIRRVPVLDGDRVVGIVSRSDIVKQLAMRWVCHTCGEVVRGAVAPDQCPRCGAGQETFTHQAELPGD